MSLSSTTFTFDDDLVKKCDEIAQSYLDKVKTKKVLPEYHSIQYVEKHSGDILLVCADGTFLFTPNELGSRLNIKAFCNGLRSDPQALQNRSDAREWELALS